MMLGVYISTFAHDFEVDGIYYTITSVTNLTVRVTFRGSSYDAIANEYTGEVIIPDSVTYSGTIYSVTSIGNYAFRDCAGLTEVTIPNSVTSIGKGAFCWCEELVTVNFNATNCTQMGNVSNPVFSGCRKMTTLKIGDNVTTIPDFAFFECYSLTSLTIPNSVTFIGNSAFKDCPSSLISVVVSAENSVYDSRNNCNAIIETLTNTLIVGCKNSTIPNSVTTIGDYAFNNCDSLNMVTIPNSVNSIGNFAFSSCTGLTSVTISNSVTTIGDYTFNNCNSLNTVDIPNSVNSIGKGAFQNCYSLSSVTIGNSVTTIGDYAFNNCDRLNMVTLPISVIFIGENAFRDCSSLNSMTIPNSVTSIGKESFYMCSELNSVIIGSSVASIGSHAFGYCNKLSEITSLNATPPECGTGAFAIYSSILRVPENSIEAYKSAEVWENFYNIVSGVNDIIADENINVEVARYNINGRKLSQPSKGINIIKMSDGSIRKERVKE